MAALGGELDGRPDAVAKTRWGLLASLLRDLSAEPTHKDLAPAVLAVEQVRLEPTPRTRRQLARHVLGSVAFRVVFPAPEPPLPARHQVTSSIRSPSSRASARRPRCKRERTVPRGVPIASAASYVEKPERSTSVIATRCSSGSSRIARNRSSRST